MYRIVICDDEIFFCTHIRKVIEKYVEPLSIDIEIKSYTGSDDFIANIKEEADLYFLDIKMPGNSGLELAGVIRNISSDAKIIFVSSLSDAVYESIHYSPFRFIRKENIDRELTEALDAVFKVVPSSNSVIEVHTSHGDTFIPVNTIRYIETSNHYLNFFTPTETYTVRGKLSDYAPLLSPYAILQVNQSYLINLGYISAYHNHSITLKNNHTINISRSYRASFKEEFLKYQRSTYHVTVLYSN